ncbi:MAG TPA: undecaprenyl-diphosphate phosphatase [Candidatus Bipolaricaulota bacterium]
MLFLLLGLIQGLTEFLPISSSGHLALAEVWLGVEKPGLLLDALLHLGTAGSVIFFYRERIGALLRHPWSDETRRLGGGLVVAMLPAVVFGLTLRGWVEAAFAAPVAVATGLLWTGGVLFFRPRKRQAPLQVRHWAWPFLLVGLAQALALFPGVSRSGMTIAAGLWLGWSWERAAEFSFFLAIPAILGATALQLVESVEVWQAHQALWSWYLAGVGVAMVCGVFAIGALLGFLQRGRLRWFAYYCWALGLGVLAWKWLG